MLEDKLGISTKEAYILQFLKVSVITWLQFPF